MTDLLKADPRRSLAATAVAVGYADQADAEGNLWSFGTYRGE